MKLNQLALLGITSLLISPLAVSSHVVRVSANPSSGESNAIMVAQRQQLVAQISGTFVAAEQPTSGMARIVTDKGRRYLVLDSAFKTSSQGPDLHVVLDPTEKPPMQYQDPTSYVNLGKLQKFNGEQRYPIPAAINLSNFKSVAIWCRMANATFGYAPLRPTTSAGTSQ
ncbi:DM13 domain-containing protein [Chlorogloeopsis sp. ULAP02]|uniref:DM13 domain-containing protein n=1 Tax=Chlorogloeopsis sp. ULAP02 TaxID=3107926 RepID=UPI00313730B1